MWNSKYVFDWNAHCPCSLPMPLIGKASCFLSLVLIVVRENYQSPLPVFLPMILAATTLTLIPHCPCSLPGHKGQRRNLKHFFNCNPKSPGFFATNVIAMNGNFNTSFTSHPKCPWSLQFHLKASMKIEIWVGL
jgi:hypothetical protein